MVELSFRFEPNLSHIFECGQCFRWNVQPDGSYIGVAGNEAVHAQVCGNKLILNGTNNIKFWENYFDTAFDYENLKLNFIKDKTLKTCIEYGYGIRILRQDLFETIISFIISQRKNIPAIKTSVEKLSRLCGTPLGDGFYEFPTAEQILTAEELRSTGVGYRDEYIYKTAQFILNGEFDLDNLIKLSTVEAKQELLKLPGIGEKVANCILLFGMNRFDTFPIDTWIERIFDKIYDIPTKEIAQFAETKFGQYRGLAQQYLFYYYRENLKNIS